MEKKEREKTIYTYIFWLRYIVLIIESVIYFINAKQSIEIKIFLLGMLFFLVAVMNYLYRENKHNPMRVATLGIIEICGNSLLVVVSGGAFSPYIWYVINTMFITALCFGEQYIFLNGMAYVIMLLVVCFSIPKEGWVSVINQMVIFNLFFIMLCGVGMIRLLIKKTNELEKRKQELLNMNDALERSKAETQEALKCVMQTYEMLTRSSTYSSVQEAWNVAFDYMIEVLKIPKVMFVGKNSTGERESYYFRGMEEEEQLELLRLHQKEQEKNKEDLKVEKVDACFLRVPISYANEYFGVLYVATNQMNSGLQFVKELCALTLNNLRIEEMNQMLLINEEQNRIANEIHDGALQQLFGVGCHLHILSKQINSLPIEVLKERIEADQKIVQHIMGEIREIIYGMSWKNRGTNYFISKLQSYIEQMENLYHAKIFLKIEGDIEGIHAKRVMALYRIICEGIANGLKHGEADEVEIELAIGEKEIQLEIKDRGIGFDYQAVEERQSFGLGIKNMKQLALSMNGHCHIDSHVGQGTQIVVEMPTGTI